MTELSDDFLKILWYKSNGICECVNQYHGHGHIQCSIYLVFSKERKASCLASWNEIREKYKRNWFVIFTGAWNDLTYENADVVCSYCYNITNGNDVEKNKSELIQIRRNSGFWISRDNPMRKLSQP